MRSNSATQPIVMRQGTLEQIARELAPREDGAPGAISKVIAAAREPVADEFKMAILEEILKQATFELGTHIPVAGIVVSIARVVNDVRESSIRRFDDSRRT